MGRPFRTFTVLPQLPKRLEALHKLAYNLWIAWHHEATALFRRIDADLWAETGHSPVKLLGRVPQARLEQLADDDGFLAHLDRVEEAFDGYMGDMQFGSVVRWEKEALDLKVDLPRAEPAGTRALIAQWPLLQPAEARVHLKGKPPELDVDLKAKIGAGCAVAELPQVKVVLDDAVGDMMASVEAAGAITAGAGL